MGYWGNNYFNENYWEPNFWIESESDSSGDFYILSDFVTGDTVTIDIYRLSDDVQVVSAASMSEIGSTGMFKYGFSQTIISDQGYLYVSSNGSNTDKGKVILGSVLTSEEQVKLFALDTESVDIAKVNGITIDGIGSDADPWGPV